MNAKRKEDEHRIPTEDLPAVGSGRHGDREIRVSISVIIGAIMMAIGIATFASNFVFATKTELSDLKVERVREESAILTDLALLKESVRNLSAEIQVHGEEARQRADRIDENLKKLTKGAR